MNLYELCVCVHTVFTDVCRSVLNAKCVSFNSVVNLKHLLHEYSVDKCHYAVFIQVHITCMNFILTPYEPENTVTRREENDSF